MNKAAVNVRPAWVGDIPAIDALLSIYAKREIVLPRPRTDLACHLANFVVAEAVETGLLAGCCALRDFGGDLLEVRSLVVAEEMQGCGVGRAMLEYLLAVTQKQRPGGCRIFTLTCQQKFFEKLGFAVVDKSAFPEKIWSDCATCPKADHCDEIALLRKLQGANA